ncbi:MAG: dihydropteroate synthase [Anaerolineales bacterium]|nr:dihydropteroate synthase [Anaerolineales bacterium]
MIIIGEKINGTLKKTAQAIAERDAAFINSLAARQAAAGADYIDVNAGTGGGNETTDLLWLIDIVQEAVNVPLCLDSANPAALKAGMAAVSQTPMVNSISGEARRLEGILPLVAEKESPVIALLLDDAGIPENLEGRLKIGRLLMENTRSAGIPDSRVFIDPLAMAVSTKTEGAVVAIDSMKILREEYPEVKFSVGLSNISFGLPGRTLINQAFLAQLLAAGLDAAIINPMEQGLINMLYATEMILGRDRFCRNYTTAFRKGRIEL